MAMGFSSYLRGPTFEIVPGLLECPLLVLNLTNTFKVQCLNASDGYVANEDGFSEPCHSLCFLLPPLHSSFRWFRDKIQETIYRGFLPYLDPASIDQVMPHVLVEIFTNIGASKYMGFCLAVHVEVVKVTSRRWWAAARSHQLDETLIMDTLEASLTRLTASRSLPGAGNMTKKEIYAAAAGGDDDLGDGDYKNNCSSGCCAVCLENFCDGMEVLRLPCCHIFHGPCIFKWFPRKTSCPMCRTEFINF